MKSNGPAIYSRGFDLSTATGIGELVKLAFGTDGSGTVRVLAALLAVLAIVRILKFLLTHVADLKKTFWREFVVPFVYSPEQKHQAKRRRQVAARVAHQIEYLSNQQQWHDSRYAEFEAEVKTPGSPGPRWLDLLRLPAAGTGAKRFSLSRALSQTRHEHIVLEGDPGSGKTVALRHVALRYARRAVKSRSIKSVIPVCANLRGLKRRPHEAIDADLIKRFVFASLNPSEDKETQKFLTQEFAPGLEAGTWLFLFDSFDEIPELLAASEADAVVAKYAAAIADFATHFNSCRVLLASREFKGPRALPWPKFRVSALSTVRVKSLMNRAGLNDPLQTLVTSGIAAAPPGFQFVASNPMFLGLLCDYVQKKGTFPVSLFDVFSQFVGRRLNDDRERITQHFQVSVEEVQKCARIIAFCMCDRGNLGLNPTLAEIDSAVATSPLPIEQDRLHTLINALATTKLALLETNESPEDATTFAFAHRRLQEYFATIVVCSEPELVSSSRLLTDGRWRESAVVLLQTAPRTVLEPLLEEAESLITRQHLDHTDLREKWPHGTLALLSLLMDGLLGRVGIIPASLQTLASRLIETAFRSGVVLDKKHALGVVGIAEEGLKLQVFREAFSGSSAVVRDAAYMQLSRLSRVPDDLATAIRASLMRFSHSSRLSTERLRIYGSLYRLTDSARYIDLANLLRWRRVLDTVQLCSIPLILYFGMALTSIPQMILLAGVGFVLIRFAPASLRAWDSRILSEQYDRFSRADESGHRSITRLGMIIARGIIPVFCLFLAILFAVGSSPELATTAFVSAYMAALVLSVTSMTAADVCLRRWFWPLGVVAPIVRWRQQARERERESMVAGIVKIVGVSVVGGGVLLAAVIAADDNNALLPPVFRSMLRIMLALFGYAVALMVVVIAIGLVWGASSRLFRTYQHVREIRRARAIEGRWTAEVTAHALVSALSTLKRPDVAAKLLCEVRVGGRLRASNEARAVLRELSYAGANQQSYANETSTVCKELLISSLVQDELADLEQQITQRLAGTS